MSMWCVCRSKPSGLEATDPVFTGRAVFGAQVYMWPANCMVLFSNVFFFCFFFAVV